jgi:nicotinate-nucleotide adenylyltransferase
MKKIGLLGGTFDPIHNGHLIIAEYLRDALDLHEVWFVPSKIHPLKNNKDITFADLRLRMIELAIQNNEYFKTCDIEIKREGISYTIQTIEDLLTSYHHLHPKFFFLIGMDNVNELHLWKDPLQILKKCQVVAFGRPGFVPDDACKRYLPYIQFVHVPLLEISSTDIRNRLKEGRTVRYLIPDSVWQLIKQEKLYG